MQQWYIREVEAAPEQTHQRHPTDREVLLALVSFAQDGGDITAALRYAREIAALYPADPQFRKLVSDLEKKARP
jgi:Flp pilus assembly protein TadD